MWVYVSSRESHWTWTTFNFFSSCWGYKLRSNQWKLKSVSYFAISELFEPHCFWEKPKKSFEAQRSLFFKYGGLFSQFGCCVFAIISQGCSVWQLFKYNINTHGYCTKIGFWISLCFPGQDVSQLCDQLQLLGAGVSVISLPAVQTDQKWLCGGWPGYGFYLAVISAGGFHHLWKWFGLEGGRGSEK